MLPKRSFHTARTTTPSSGCLVSASTMVPRQGVRRRRAWHRTSAEQGRRREQWSFALEDLLFVPVASRPKQPVVHDRGTYGSPNVNRQALPLAIERRDYSRCRLAVQQDQK